jgi:dihydroneopterin aldolase
MLDTAEKSAGGLRSHLTRSELTYFLAEARSHGLLAGLAGSLQQADARALAPLRPDVLGFRGALCGSGERSGALQAERVRSMRALIPRAGGVNEAASDALLAEEG